MLFNAVNGNGPCGSQFCALQPLVYRKCELSKGEMDRLWPHQVALPAYRCIGHR